jgi:predicted NAD-dependent protein-ADP-ribosyltransferase YbiA (DUF1768 family)
LADNLAYRRGAEKLKLSFQNDVIGLSAETPDEQEICALLAVADGHVFQLHASSGRGMAFSMIGPEDAARRAPLNVVQSIAPRFAPISNLAHTPFELGGQRYASIEGFWQGLKRLDPVERRAMAKLWGGEARERGASVDQPAEFHYEGVKIAAGSPEHWALMRAACEAKFTQHDEARIALLATEERWLTHKVRRDSRTIPGPIMADIWMQIRARLRDEAGSRQ